MPLLPSIAGAYVPSSTCAFKDAAGRLVVVRTDRGRHHFVGTDLVSVRSTADGPLGHMADVGGTMAKDAIRFAREDRNAMTR